MFSTTKEKAQKIDGTYKHKKRVDKYISKNVNRSLKFVEKSGWQGVFSRKNYRMSFSLSGSYVFNDLTQLEFPSVDFIQQIPGRYFQNSTSKGNIYHSRGARYLVALDPHYSVIQKLDILKQDIRDCLRCLARYQVKPNQHLSVSIVLDYLKNSLVTLLNSYLHEEKIGEFKLGNHGYQANRAALIEATESVVYAYYLSLRDGLDSNDILDLMNSLSNELIEEIALEIRHDYRKFSFSSKSLTRPEATHPLILMSYAFNLCFEHKKADLVVGMPSGSTEAACLVKKVAQHVYHNPQVRLNLVPYSIHSVKDIGERHRQSAGANFQKLFQTRGDEGNVEKVLIIDDNSASGRTIEKVYNLVKRRYVNSKIICSVVEADLRRISINLSSPEDCFVAHPMLFKYSMGVLPVSKLILPKYDLKEIQERRMLRKYYMNIKPRNTVESIVFEVIADSLEHRVEENWQLLNNGSNILSFKHTFLSNFYAVNFRYKGRNYSSVEQAYLRQKFDDSVLNQLSPKQKEVLNDVLRMKGIQDKKNDFTKAFYDFKIPAGVLKRWSNKLKEWGLESKDWDEKRLMIMTELLILKFRNVDMMRRLIETQDAYLIEGNDWNDTFWGVCNGRGRNYLGRLLMAIRARILTGELV